MSVLEKYKKLKGDIGVAKRWLSHFSATGRDNSRCDLHSTSFNCSPSIQYSTGSKNYWDLSEEAKALQLYIQKILIAKIPVIAAEAIQLMQAELNRLKEEAQKEYRDLFEAEITRPEAALALAKEGK